MLGRACGCILFTGNRKRSGPERPALMFDDDSVFIITPLGLRHLELEAKDCAGKISKKQARELREIRVGVRTLSEIQVLETVIPHLKTFEETRQAMERLSELSPRHPKPKRLRHRKTPRRDPRFLAF